MPRRRSDTESSGDDEFRSNRPKMNNALKDKAVALVRSFLTKHLTVDVSQRSVVEVINCLCRDELHLIRQSVIDADAPQESRAFHGFLLTYILVATISAVRPTHENFHKVAFNIKDAISNPELKEPSIAEINRQRAKMNPPLPAISDALGDLSGLVVTNQVDIDYWKSANALFENMCGLNQDPENHPGGMMSNDTETLDAISRAIDNAIVNEPGNPYAKEFFTLETRALRQHHERVALGAAQNPAIVVPEMTKVQLLTTIIRSWKGDPNNGIEPVRQPIAKREAPAVSADNFIRLAAGAKYKAWAPDLSISTASRELLVACYGGVRQMMEKTLSNWDKDSLKKLYPKVFDRIRESWIGVQADAIQLNLFTAMTTTSCYNQMLRGAVDTTQLLMNNERSMKLEKKMHMIDSKDKEVKELKVANSRLSGTVQDLTASMKTLKADVVTLKRASGNGGPLLNPRLSAKELKKREAEDRRSVAASERLKRQRDQGQDEAAGKRTNRICAEWVKMGRDKRTPGTCGDPSCTHSHKYSSMPKTRREMENTVKYFTGKTYLPSLAEYKDSGLIDLDYDLDGNLKKEDEE